MGADIITAEEIVVAGEEGVDKIFALGLCSKTWKEEQIPDEWAIFSIVPIFKKRQASM